MRRRGDGCKVAPSDGPGVVSLSEPATVLEETGSTCEFGRLQGASNVAHQIHAATTASVSELKKNPMGAVAAGEGFPVAILNRNEPVFYCVPAKAWEAMLERLEDLELNAIADSREGQAVHKVSLDEL